MKSVVLPGACGAIGRATIQHLVTSGVMKRGRFPLDVLVDPVYARPDKSADLEAMRLHLTTCPQRPDLNAQLQDTIEVKGSKLVLDGRPVEVLTFTDPAQYVGALRDALIYEATGLAADNAEFAQAYLAAGASKVFITAPAKHAQASVIYGLNHNGDNLAKLRAAQIIAGLSCTTGCIAFPIKVVHDTWGVVYGFMITIHAYTNDQRLHDGRHKDPRRARGVDGKAIATSTGAAGAIGLAIPELKGRLDGFAVRGPWPDGSLAVIFLLTEKKVTTSDLHSAMIEAVPRFSDRMAVTTRADYVLKDVVGRPYSSVVDIGRIKEGDPESAFTRVYGITPSIVGSVAMERVIGALSGFNLTDGSTIAKLTSFVKGALFGSAVVIHAYYDNVWGTSEGYIQAAEHVRIL